MAARTGLREAPGARAPPGPAGMQRGAGQRSSRQQCTHERTHPCWRTLTHSHTHTLSMHPRSCTLTHTRSHTHALTHSRMHPCSHARTQSCSHTLCMHAHAHTLRTHPGTYLGTPVQGAPPGSNAASVCMLREAGAWGLPARLGTDRRGLWWQPGATRREDAGLCSLGRAATPPGSWGTAGCAATPLGADHACRSQVPGPASLAPSCVFPAPPRGVGPAAMRPAGGSHHR